jgi:DNA-directed RNA polymerase subunit K/omega
MDTVPDWVLGTAPMPALLAHIRPLSRFEEAVVVGRRALQLSQGAQPMVVVAASKQHDPVAIAMEELKCNQVPEMRVFRYLPDGTHVTVNVRQFNLGPATRVRAW